MYEFDFIQLINRYENLVKSYISRRVFNKNDIEDLTQEVFYRFLKSINSFNNRCNITTYIIAICKNVLCEYLRDIKRENNLIKKITEIRMKEKLTNNKINNLNISFYCDFFVDNYKIVFELYYIKGYTIKEIGRLLNRPEGTIKFMLYKIREKLKKFI